MADMGKPFNAPQDNKVDEGGHLKPIGIEQAVHLEHNFTYYKSRKEKDIFILQKKEYIIEKFLERVKDI